MDCPPTSLPLPSPDTQDVSSWPQTSNFFTPTELSITSSIASETVESIATGALTASEDIRLFMSTVAAQKPWLYDPQASLIPWRPEEEILPGKLCFGFGMGDGTVQPSPPLQRAMNLTTAALTLAGHTFIDFIPTKSTEATDLSIKFWSADGGQEFQRDTDLSGEPLHPEIERWLGRSANTKPQTVSETWQNQHQRTLLATRWLERWQATKEITGTGRPIDGLIMPSTYPVSSKQT